MSFFSYISFPRKADTSCLSNKLDKSKVFTVAEIRGTGLDNGSLDALPDGANVYLGDLVTDSQGIRVFDNRGASFIDVFTNRFIYCLEAAFELLDVEKYIEACMKIIYDDEPDNGNMNEEDHMNFVYGMIEHNKADVAICRKQLYELVQINTNPDETVEIYTEWVSGAIAELGPAKERVL
ncbi:MAG: hypothetical protein LBT12_00745, partial [Oscillospiraceae bacterium]|nr:hypothetical protein [Oscillospiraceae bacterium]